MQYIQTYQQFVNQESVNESINSYLDMITEKRANKDMLLGLKIPSIAWEYINAIRKVDDDYGLVFYNQSENKLWICVGDAFGNVVQPYYDKLKELGHFSSIAYEDECYPDNLSSVRAGQSDWICLTLEIENSSDFYI